MKLNETHYNILIYASFGVYITSLAILCINCVFVSLIVMESDFPSNIAPEMVWGYSWNLFYLTYLAPMWYVILIYYISGAVALTIDNRRENMKKE